MRKLISSILIVALSLPLMAQEVEVKEKDGKTEVTIKKQRGDKKRGDRRMMEQRKKMAKKHKIRQIVRMAVIGGISYYVGYHQGQHEKHFKGGMKRRPGMGDK